MKLAIALTALLLSTAAYADGVLKKDGILVTSSGMTV